MKKQELIRHLIVNFSLSEHDAVEVATDIINKRKSGVGRVWVRVEDGNLIYRVPFMKKVW